MSRRPVRVNATKGASAEASVEQRRALYKTGRVPVAVPTKRGDH